MSESVEQAALDAPDDSLCLAAPSTSVHGIALIAPTELPSGLWLCSHEVDEAVEKQLRRPEDPRVGDVLSKVRSRGADTPWSQCSTARKWGQLGSVRQWQATSDVKVRPRQPETLRAFVWQLFLQEERCRSTHGIAQ